MHQLAQNPAEDGAVSAHDRELVSEVLRKDRKASAEFVGRCADYAYPFVRHAVMPRSEVVEDLMQEILLAAWRNLGTFRGEASLRAWILGIARHKVKTTIENESGKQNYQKTTKMCPSRRCWQTSKQNWSPPNGRSVCAEFLLECLKLMPSHCFGDIEMKKVCERLRN